MKKVALFTSTVAGICLAMTSCANPIVETVPNITDTTPEQIATPVKVVSNQEKEQAFFDYFSA